MGQWYAKQLSKLTNVTVRTLHHYHQIGLLQPSERLSNGYRVYSEKDLVKLQQIIALKHFGFELLEIKTLLDKPVDILDHLRGQARMLEKQAKSLMNASEVLNQVIKECSQGKSIAPETVIKLIGVFQMENTQWHEPESQKQNEYEQYLVENGKVSAEKLQAAKDKAKEWSEADILAFKNTADDINKHLAAAMLKGLAPDTQEVQALIAKHFKWICLAWTPERESYKGLSQMYLDHQGFRDFYDAYTPGLVEYLAKAMVIYADRNLK